MCSLCPLVPRPVKYYNAEEAKKYSSNSRIQSIQAEMTYRCLELLQLPASAEDEDEPRPSYLLDIGAGSGLSGEILTEEGHDWVGLDISGGMLEVALERDIEGDLFLADIGQGIPFRAGSFDGAISVSVLQWLCNADATAHSPPQRLLRFFTDLFGVLTRGSRAVFQFYPESDEQVKFIMNFATKAGFGGGLCVDYPNSSKRKKFYLVLFAGQPADASLRKPQTVPAGLGVDGADQVAYERKRADRARKGKDGKRKGVKDLDWILKKKELYRARAAGQPFIRSMRLTAGALAVGLVLVTPALALSSSCLHSQTVLVGSEFGTCADLVGFEKSVLMTQFGIIQPLNEWLTSMCGTTCSADSIKNATATVEAGCSADRNDGIQNAVGLSAIIGNYSQTRSALCTQSTSNSTFCLSNLLESVQNFTGTSLTWVEFERLSLNAFAIPNSILCTDCTKALITNLRPLAPNLATNVTARCGAAFGDGDVPGTVKVAASLEKLPFGGAQQKAALRKLQDVFTAPPTKGPDPSFPSLVLPAETQALVEQHLSQFAASFPLGGGGGHQREVEGERERTRWREGLVEIWASVEPLPGTEGDPLVIARVSAFLVLLEQLSAGVGDDDDSALVARKDIGDVWWSALLRRAMLGTAKEGANIKPTDKPRGRIGTPKWIKESLGPSQPAGSTMRPLTVSRAALDAASRMVSWGMATDPDLKQDLSPFGHVVWAEFKERAVAMLKGFDEGYGVRNLEECIIGWGDKAPEAFFSQIAPRLALSSPSRLSFLSLLLAFLTRHPAKSYHGLKTNLLAEINKLCLLSPSPAMVTISIKCLAIFLVTLPVIIGELNLYGTFAVYGRVVTWERIGETGEGGTRLEPDQEQGFEDMPLTEEALDGPPPDPLILFTVLYGTYPCNFTAFLRDPVGYLRGKNWTGASGDGDIAFDSAAVKDRSTPLIRQHTLHPSLFTSDLAVELTDTNRWRRLEAADVMAECDRNLVHVAESVDVRDPGAVTPPLPSSRETSRPPRQSTSQLTFSSPDSNPAEEPESGERSVTPIPFPASALRSPSSTSRSRTRTPLLPSTTHYSNFQALQSVPMSPRRSSSPFARSSADSSAANSRRSSYVGAMSASMLNSKTLPPGSLQLVRLETELIVLQGEVNFQAYLKQLHLAHMGTLHREKVLDSGAEAERQSLYRTIRTLRGQLKQTKSSLEKLRAESGVTKANWIAHIADLQERLKTLRAQRLEWDAEGGRLRAEVEELKQRVQKQAGELEAEGAELFDLQNQVAVDSAKLARIEQYELRIEALTRAVAICDEDLHKHAEQRRDMDKLVGEWKKSEMLRDAAETEVASLKATIRDQETELASIRNLVVDSAAPPEATSTFEGPSSMTKDSLSVMRAEMERLRARNAILEEEKKEREEAAAGGLTESRQ
ncbi:hypothetical protein RQP46_007179 [Phenoliferia psychrophenolica]